MAELPLPTAGTAYCSTSLVATVSPSLQGVGTTCEWMVLYVSVLHLSLLSLSPLSLCSYELLLRCWSSNADARPSFSELVSKFDSLAPAREMEAEGEAVDSDQQQSATISSPLQHIQLVANGNTPTDSLPPTLSLTSNGSFTDPLLSPSSSTPDSASVAMVTGLPHRPFAGFLRQNKDCQETEL